ncbi:hypothetical protein M9H77_26620 [Catharanthus roseus]|uniref:Uncharacterized protein n=1 Tax=Catharanthus roseus TaxID=4058 RepID=A0ACC0ACX1_CATRO|nr:hypothetical protein M9H77_26620 [Catharanthus roseus]
MLPRRSGRRHRGTVSRGVVAWCPASTPGGLAFLIFEISFILAGENGRGMCMIRVVHPTALAKGRVGRHAKYQELKTNAERLHIKTDSPMSTDEAMSTVSAHNLQPSPLSDGEATTTHHPFRLPASRGRRGYRDTCYR